MQDYIEIAAKNGVELISNGPCQFCGAQTTRGIHECMEIFNLGFQGLDFSEAKNHLYRFLIVDAHTLQHPEIHGRWSNHFHLSRLHLIFHYNIAWTYRHSPKLSDYLNQYKIEKQEEYLIVPEPLKRANITSTDILKASNDVNQCKAMIKNWAKAVYEAWRINHEVVDYIAAGYIRRYNSY